MRPAWIGVRAAAQPLVPDPERLNVSLLLHFEGANGSATFTDSSLFGHALSIASGGPVISTAQKKFGAASGSFPGARLNVAAHTSLVMGTSDFTWECWFRLNAATGAHQAIIAVDDVSGPSRFQFATGPGEILEIIRGGSIVLSSATPVTVGAWTHIEYDRTAGMGYLFQDGVLKASGADATNYSNTAQMEIGGSVASGTSQCYIDELRITKGVARHTANFTPRSTAYPNP